MATFDWIENPDKDIAESTRKSYQARLNAIARLGYNNREQLLSNASAVRTFIDNNNSKQMRNLYYAAVFYALGRIDPLTEPRGETLIEGFQKNYYGK